MIGLWATLSVCFSTTYHSKTLTFNFFSGLIKTLAPLPAPLIKLKKKLKKKRPQTVTVVKRRDRVAHSSVTPALQAPAPLSVQAPSPQSKMSTTSETSVKTVPTAEEVLEQIEALIAGKKAEMEKLRELKKSMKGALANARKRRTPEERAAEAARPKRPLSEKQQLWNAFVDSVYAELKKKDTNAKRKDAMKLAKERRAAGKAPGLPPLPTDEEKEAAKAAKKAEKEAKKAAKKGKAAKATKAAKAAESAAAVSDVESSDSESSDSDSSDSDSEEETLAVFTLKGKQYFRSKANECWHRAADGTLGLWAGIFDPAKNKIRPAPEPAVTA